MKGRCTKSFRAVVAIGAVALLFATVSAASATPTTGGGFPLSRSTASAVSGEAAGDRNGGWIAYSTAPVADVYHATNPWRPGADVFVIQKRDRPKLLARGRHHAIWNVCPSFSPNGRMLAFARVVPGAVSAGSTVVVVRITSRGPVRAGRVVLNVPGGAARCPRWSANSSRLAYLYRGKVVIRGLDGTRKHRAKGDPTIRDFDTSGKEIVSPTGELIATLGDSSIIISRPDGTTQSTIPDNGSYAIAGWSPDGRALLLMQDVGGGFQMRAVSVDPPFVSRTVVDYVGVNGARSWPGYGDVSWQPKPRRP
jgi:WD40 repeat protein